MFKNKLRQLVLLTLPLITNSAVAAEIYGTWFAADDAAFIQELTIVPETASDFAIGSVFAAGDCWQCTEEPANLFALPVDQFAVLPGASQAGVTEILELSLEEDGVLLATLTYRVPPDVCNPPFNCQWVVVDQIVETLIK